ncbi:MAG: polyamine aminopropyltransferase [Dehalococcoidales bacterium]|nr:MAG: polyamine aminopropyltransferase [Dehalococcoidales bacterium]
MEVDPDKWFHDRISEDLIQLHSIEEILYKGQTKFQSIQIIRTGSYGKCLVLDNKIQSSELDEFIYHEALIHPVLTIHQNPETVFIAGGGEGATLREILRHNTVKNIVMVDIDEEVISICKEYLPEHHQDSFENERIKLYHTDARQYLADSKEAFDIIIIDLTEPIEEGPAYLLYTEEFYRIVQEKLAENGIMSVQSGCAAFNELLNFSSVYNTLKTSFPEVHPYQVDIPSFGGPWGFCFASNTAKPVMSSKEIDARLMGRGVTGLKLYDGITHQNMFALPKHLRKVLESQTRLITDDQPLYTYSG